MAAGQLILDYHCQAGPERQCVLLTTRQTGRQSQSIKKVVSLQPRKLAAPESSGWPLMLALLSGTMQLTQAMSSSQWQARWQKQAKGTMAAAAHTKACSSQHSQASQMHLQQPERLYFVHSGLSCCGVGRPASKPSDTVLQAIAPSLLTAAQALAQPFCQQHITG